MDNIWHNFRTCSVREKLLLLVSLKASIYTLLFGFYFLSTDLVLAGSSAFVVASIYMTQFCLTLKGRAWEGVLLGFYAATLVIPFYMLMSGGIYSPVGIYCFQIATMAPIAFNRNRLFHCILTSIILGTVLLVGIIIDYSQVKDDQGNKVFPSNPAPFLSDGNNRVTTDNHVPYRIYGAQQDNSTVRISGSSSSSSPRTRTRSGGSSSRR